MTTAVEAAERSLLWSHEVLGLHAIADSAGSVRLGAPGQDWNSLLPLVEVTVTGHGRTWSGERFIDTAIGDRLIYRGHETGQDGAWHGADGRLTVSLPRPNTAVLLRLGAALPAEGRQV